MKGLKADDNPSKLMDQKKIKGPSVNVRENGWMLKEIRWWLKREKVAIKKKSKRTLLDKNSHGKDISDKKNEPRLKFEEIYESKEICT